MVVTVRLPFDIVAQPSALEIATVELQMIDVLQKKCPQAQLKRRV